MDSRCLRSGIPSVWPSFAGRLIPEHSPINGWWFETPGLPSATLVQGSPHVTPDPQAADRAIHVLAVLEAGGAPSPQPAAAAVSDVDDTPVHCSPLTFAISEATASATIREMTRTEPGASAVASPVRTAPALRAMTPVKQSGAAAAPAAGIPVTVAADMHLVTAPAADMRRWLSTQLAAGHFREYGSLSRSGGSGSGDAGRRS